jgi:hypothetical protein
LRLISVGLSSQNNCLKDGKFDEALRRFTAATSQQNVDDSPGSQARK